MGYNTLRNHLQPAGEALMGMATASEVLQHEQHRLKASEETLMELGVPQDDEAQS